MENPSDNIGNQNRDFPLVAQYLNWLRHRVPQAKILQSFELLTTYWRVMGAVRYRKYHSSSSFIRVWGQTSFPLNGYSLVTVRLQFGYSSVTVRLQFGYFSVTVRVQFGYSSVTFRLQFGYSSVTFLLEFGYSSVTVRVQFC
jgi:hypothetical protein